MLYYPVPAAMHEPVRLVFHTGFCGLTGCWTLQVHQTIHQGRASVFFASGISRARPIQLQLVTVSDLFLIRELAQGVHL